MTSFICLTSAIWSSSYLIIAGTCGHTISYLNFAWFAVSIAALAYQMQEIHDALER